MRPSLKILRLSSFGCQTRCLKFLPHTAPVLCVCQSAQEDWEFPSLTPHSHSDKMRSVRVLGGDRNDTALKIHPMSLECSLPLVSADLRQTSVSRAARTAPPPQLPFSHDNDGAAASAVVPSAVVLAFGRCEDGAAASAPDARRRFGAPDAASADALSQQLCGDASQGRRHALRPCVVA